MIARSKRAQRELTALPQGQNIQCLLLLKQQLTCCIEDFTFLIQGAARSWKIRILLQLESRQEKSIPACWTEKLSGGENEQGFGSVLWTYSAECPGHQCVKSHGDMNYLFMSDTSTSFKHMWVEWVSMSLPALSAYSGFPNTPDQTKAELGERVIDEA